MFWWDCIVWSTWNFFFLPNCPCQLQVSFLCSILISTQSNTLCCNPAGQPDGQAGLRREPYRGCKIDTSMNLLSVFSFPYFARLRNSTKKIVFYCTKQRLDLSGNPGSDAVGGRSFYRFVSKMVFFIFSLLRHLWVVLTPFKKLDSVHHTHESTLLLPCLSVSMFVVGNSLILPSLPVRKVVACNYNTKYEMGWIQWETQK
jgi:hypothetical protein